MNTFIALIITSQLLSCSTITMKEYFSNIRQPAAIEVDNDKEIQELKRLTMQLEKKALLLSEKHNINFSPWMIRDYVARRFINKADWETYLKRIKDKDSSLAIDEKEVYKPAPITWDNWLNTSLIIEDRALEEKDLSLDEVLNWNLLSVQGTIPDSIKLGKLKSFSNYGSNTKERDALSKEEISAINDIDLKFLSPWIKKFSDKNLIKKFSLKWTSLVCEESLPAKLDFIKNNTQCRIIYEQLKLASHFKINNLEVINDIQKMENGVLENQDALHAWWWYACWPRLSAKEIEELPNQCGMITYLESGKTKNALGLLIKGINGFLSTPRSPQESFYFALKTQRAK